MIHLGGVSVNAKTMLACEEELVHLDEVLPSSADERDKWVLGARTKPAHFDVEWNATEDSKLLMGIYQYGMGSWEQIKMDPSLGISDKILSNEDKKPQAKHLQSRAEYLLKVLKKQHELKKGITKPKRQRKTKEKVLTKEIIENDDMSSNDETNNHILNTSVQSPLLQPKKVPKMKNEDESESMSPSKEKKEKKKRERKVSGPMHFTANNEPQSLDVLGGLDPSVFNEVSEIYN